MKPDPIACFEALYLAHRHVAKREWADAAQALETVIETCPSDSLVRDVFSPQLEDVRRREKSGLSRFVAGFRREARNA